MKITSELLVQEIWNFIRKEIILTSTNSIWIILLCVLTIARIVTILNVDVVYDIKHIKYIQKWIIKFGNNYVVIYIACYSYWLSKLAIYICYKFLYSYCLNFNVTIVWIVPKNRNNSVSKLSSVLRRVTYSYFSHHLGPTWVPPGFLSK
jgi:hypothetical protein